MTQQKNTGMRLRQGINPRQKDVAWLLRMVVAMLACAVLTFTVTAVTGNSWVVMLAVAVWLCVIYGILLKTKQENWFYIGILLVMLLLVLIFRRHVLEGFRLFWNTASDALVSGTGMVLPEWELKLGREQSELCAALFAGTAACGLGLVCCFLTSAAPAALAVVLPVTLLVGMTVFGADVSVFRMLPVLVVSVLILVYSGWQKKNAVTSVVMSWVVSGIAACLLLAMMLLPGVQTWSAQIREDVQETIHEKRYETKYTTLPEGDFSDYKKTEHEAEQALVVTMQVPQQMYLRGFTGAVFTGDAWEGLDTESLAKNKDLLYWLNLNAFDQNAQFDAAATSVGMEQSTVTIQNIGACSNYLYVPFSIGKGAWAEAENLNTDGVRGKGARNYVYSVTTGSAAEIMQVLTYLQTSDDASVLRYRKAESGYRQFVRHYYLQVPTEVKELLRKQWDEVAARYGGANNLTLQQAQECALVFLSRCFPEEGTPEEMELPLKTAEGTSFQYATAAAMTLRYFGIPARYAEGYVISQEMAEQYESGENITVDSSCAKAWVEVYQDGIGWIPMDLTPGISELMKDAESSQSDRNDSSDKETTEKKDEEEEPQEDTQPESVGGGMVMVILKTMMWSLLVVAVIFLLIFLALWIRRKMLLRRREEKFCSGDIGEAVAWIYANTAVILETLGFDRGNGSMRDLATPMEEKYGAEFAAQFMAATDLNDHAMFSALAMDEVHRETVLSFRGEVLGKLKAEVKWYRRMWLKWARCLY